MLKQINTVVWFLRKPRYIPQIFQILKRSKSEDSADSRKEATDWCKKVAVSKVEALKQLGIDQDFVALEERYPKILETARKTAKDCPVDMGGEGGINVLYHILMHKRSKRIIETGVAYGWSSLAILLAIKDLKEAFLISNDMPYIKMYNDKYVGCVVPEDLRGKWKLQRYADVQGIPKALKSFDYKVDLFHYDSDKSYSGRMWSMPLIWNALVEGGIFISDDINDNIAYKIFCQQKGQKPIVFEHYGKYVGILVK